MTQLAHQCACRMVLMLISVADDVADEATRTDAEQ
jgi:hypothetical protein